MTNHIIIRQIKPEDACGIVEIWNKALFRDITTVGRFSKWLFLNPDFDPITLDGCWVAEADGKVVGFARAIIRTIPNDGMGLEEHNGWIPVMFVDPQYQRKGIGSKLFVKIVRFFKKHNRKHIFICGNTGSAPGYVFPGVDKDVYQSGFNFFIKKGFVIDHEPVAMTRSIIDFDYEKYYKEAWSEGTNEGVKIESLTPKMLLPTLTFLKKNFPGDWNMALRNKLKSGPMDEILIAIYNDEVVGFCQWEGEHFGPFGVAAHIRGKKIGAKIMVEAIRRIKAADGRTVWFNWADPDAARFYSRLDFDKTRNFAILRLDMEKVVFDDEEFEDEKESRLSGL